MTRQRVLTPIENPTGMSLVAVLAAVAIMGIIAATLTALFGNLSSVTSRANLEAQENQITNYVKLLLAQPALCDYAMRATGAIGAGPNVQWDFKGNPAAKGLINHIEINQNGLAGAAAAMALQVNTSPTTSIKVTSIYLRLPNAALGEDVTGTPAGPGPLPTVNRIYKLDADPAPVSNLFDVTPAKLVIRYELQNGSIFLGSPVRETTVDVTVAVDQTANHYVAFCKQLQDTSSTVDMSCDGNHLYPGSPDCPVDGADYCRPLYFIAGFDALGTAMCRCQTSCDGHTLINAPPPGVGGAGAGAGGGAGVGAGGPGGPGAGAGAGPGPFGSSPGGAPGGPGGN
jgi:hypothetical protein